MGKDEFVCAFEVLLILSADAIDGLSQILLLLSVVSSLLELDELLPLFDALQLLHAPQFLLRGVHHQQRILNQILLYDVIERSVGGKARSVVDFQEKHPILVVDHEVEPEQLEAHIGSGLLWAAEFVISKQVRLSSQDGLDDVVLDLTPIRIGTIAHLLEALEELGKRLLVAMRYVINRIVVLVVGVGLIDGVIGEVHEVVVEVGTVGELVLLSCKPDQSLIVQVDPQGVDTC